MSDREAFEKWARDNGIRYQSKYSTGEYYFGDADLAWKAWQAAQAQAGQPIAAVHGWFHGECVIRPLDPKAVLPAGMALYSQPQSQAVNQQLLEGWEIKKVDADEVSFLVTHPDGSSIVVQDGQPGIMAHMFIELCEAIAAAQETGK